jgi:hypothetical protein
LSLIHGIQVALKSSSQLIRLKTNLVEQGDRRGLGRSAELSPQHICADLVVMERCRAFATPHIAAHYQAVGILATRIARKQSPEILQRAAVVARLIVELGQLGQER